MRGNILEYSQHQDTGIISGQDGNRYNFSRSNIRTGSAPLKGALVDFEPSEGVATDIVYIITKGTSSTSRAVYIILALFFGLLGVHNFYAGRTTWGIILLLNTLLLTWFLVGANLAVAAIIILIEIIGVSTDGKGRPMT